jgi:hypothetical protein
VVAPTCVGWALLQQALIMCWRIRDLCGPTNLVALMVGEFDVAPPYFTDNIGIVWGPPKDADKVSRGRPTLGYGGPDSTL